MSCIGILGGTFDPIHNGHLHIAAQLHEQVGLSEIRLIPCKVPVHKEQPLASVSQRLAMLTLACQVIPYLVLDPREIERDSASYSITTVQSLRQELPNTPLCFILGSDSFNQLTTWHQWQHMTDYCHLIVIARPGHPVRQQAEQLTRRITTDPNACHTTTHGNILIANSKEYSVSATEIRAQCARGERAQDCPTAVADYIEHHKLYRTVV